MVGENQTDEQTDTTTYGNFTLCVWPGVTCGELLRGCVVA